MLNTILLANSALRLILDRHFFLDGTSAVVVSLLPPLFCSPTVLTTEILALLNTDNVDGPASDAEDEDSTFPLRSDPKPVWTVWSTGVNGVGTGEDSALEAGK